MAVTISASVGDCGAIKPVSKDVTAIQILLNQILPGQGGADPRLDADGQIGPRTKAAILAFQKHQNLGNSSCVEPGSVLIDRLNLAANGGLDSAILKKYRFTFESEIGFGTDDSTKPHWPGGISGVTIGPGYDMQFRNAVQVISDLTAVGVEATTAKALSAAAGPALTGDVAHQWVKDHAADGLRISRISEQALFESVLVLKYEKEAAAHVDQKFGAGSWAKLDSDQQAMLFDYQYNPGLSKFPKFSKAVMDADWKTVLEEYERKGVGKRNDRFKERFLDPRL